MAGKKTPHEEAESPLNCKNPKAFGSTHLLFTTAML